MDRFTYLVLGPLLVAGSDGRVSPGGAITRSVLADLLINVNRAVSADRLIEDVWGDEGWDLDRHVLHSHITRLRAIVGKDRIIQSGGAYTLTAPSDEIDAVAFEQLVQTAITADDPNTSRDLCHEAMELWRGVPYGDIGDSEFLRLEVRRLEEIRMEAMETCYKADLALGRHREIVGDLRCAVTEFPFDERLWKCYLIALRQSGRHVEALRAFEYFEKLVREELGIEPPAEIRDLRDAIASD